MRTSYCPVGYVTLHVHTDLPQCEPRRFVPKQNQLSKCTYCTQTVVVLVVLTAAVSVRTVKMSNMALATAVSSVDPYDSRLTYEERAKLRRKKRQESRENSVSEQS